MALRGHGSAIALTAAVVTVVIASAGTAVAVTSTVVNIADPVTPSRVARVDGAGRLSVAPANATIASAGLATGTSGDNFVTSPTLATLAITKLSFSNPSINAAAGVAEVRYYLFQVDASGGACTSSGGNLLGIYNIAPGDDFEETFAAPLIVKATGTTQYCLDLLGQTLSGTYNASYYPSYNLAAYVVSGKYTGVGLGAVPSSPQVIEQQEPAAAH